MARQKGLFKITGTLSDINYYTVDGVTYARKAGGGFNGDAIRTKASMIRVRENASEFGHCSSTKKQFRLALLPFLKGLKEKKLHQRMMQLFLELKSLDAVSERGHRRVYHGLQTLKGKRLLRQFEFTPKHAILEALQDHGSFDWALQKLSVRNFNMNGIKTPKTATHLGLRLGVLDFDFEDLDSVLQVSSPSYLAIGAELSYFELLPELVMPPQHTGIAILELRYYKIIGTEVYALEEKLSIGVLAVL